jgi:hypothetical protein
MYIVSTNPAQGFGLTQIKAGIIIIISLQALWVIQGSHALFLNLIIIPPANKV